MGGSLEYEEIKEVIKMFKIDTPKNFIETGTFLGKTISKMAEYFEQLYTVEISEELYKYNVEKWGEQLKNINFVKGDSSEKLKEIIEQLDDSSVFFLDGHYSGCNAVPDETVSEKNLDQVIHKTNSDEKIWKKNRVVIQTSKGKKDVPLYEELEVIDKNCKNQVLIIIDDVRLFGKIYPHGDWRKITYGKIRDCFKNKNIIKDKIYNDRLYILVE